LTDLRIGIVGLHNHYHAYPFAEYLRRGLAGMTLVAVADERAELAKAFADAYCGGDWTTDYTRLLGRSDPRCVGKYFRPRQRCGDRGECGWPRVHGPS